MVNFKLEELSQEFVRGRKKVADPQTIATATKWYRSFTGGRGNVGTDEILELYKMLEDSGFKNMIYRGNPFANYSNKRVGRIYGKK